MLTQFKVGGQCPIKMNGEIFFRMIDGAPYLILNWSDPTEKEIENIRTGRPKFALWKKGQVMLFLSKFGDLSWMDVPYNVYQDNLDNDLSDELPEGQGYALQVMLVDSGDNTIKVLRIIGLKTQFSRDLRQELLIEQSGQPYDTNQFYRETQSIYNSYSTNQIVKMAYITNQ